MIINVVTRMKRSIIRVAAVTVGAALAANKSCVDLSDLE